MILTIDDVFFVFSHLVLHIQVLYKLSLAKSNKVTLVYFKLEILENFSNSEGQFVQSETREDIDVCVHFFSRHPSPHPHIHFYSYIFSLRVFLLLLFFPLLLSLFSVPPSLSHV